MLVCVFLWRPIFLGEALLPGDYLAQMAPWNSVIEAPDPPPQWNPLAWDAIAQFYPWRVFYARSMGEGTIPLWNPHQFCGTPFLANGQSAVLYPLNALFLVFDPITAFTVYAALHLFLAAAFTYMLLRGLGLKELGGMVGGVTFAFGAFTVLWLELPTFIGAAVWLPLALLLVHRAVEHRSLFHGMLAGAALALAVLAGHFQIAFYVILAAGLWWLWSLARELKTEDWGTRLKSAGPLFGCFAALALLAAPQVLPTLELARNSHRVREVSAEGYERFLGNAVKPYRLITAFAPDFYGSPSRGDYYLIGQLGDHIGSAADYMEHGMYAGVLTLVLAGFGVWSVRRRRRHAGFFVLLGAFSLLIATGTLANAPFYYLVPGFSALGGPNRILLLYIFSIAALAAFGVESFNEGADEKLPRRRTTWGMASAAAGTLTVALIAGFLFLAIRLADPFPEPVREYVSAIGAQAWSVFAVWVVVSLAVLALRGAGVLRGAAFGAAVVAVVAADLFAFGINYNPTCDLAKVYPDTPLTKKLQAIGQDTRIAPVNPEWSLFSTPDSVMPPNAAMVYGLYDVQGYDSLYTRDYQSKMTRLQGGDPCPPENGNMALVRRPSMFLWNVTRLVLSREPLPEDDLSLKLVDTSGGVFVYTTMRPPDYDRIVAGARMGDAITVWFPEVDIDGGIGGPNRMVATFLAGPTYPGWKMVYNGKKIDRWSDLLLAPRFGETTAPFVFEPFSFRLGLFLMMLGAGSVTCAGVFRLLARRAGKR